MEDFATILKLRNECTGLRNGTRVPKGGFAVAKLPAEWGFGCEKWEFLCFGISQLQNEGHCASEWHSCAKSVFAAEKSFAEWDFCCEIRFFHFAMRFAAAK